MKQLGLKYVRIFPILAVTMCFVMIDLLATVVMCVLNKVFFQKKKKSLACLYTRHLWQMPLNHIVYFLFISSFSETWNCVAHGRKYKCFGCQSMLQKHRWKTQCASCRKELKQFSSLNVPSSPSFSCSFSLFSTFTYFSFFPLLFLFFHLLFLIPLLFLLPPKLHSWQSAGCCGCCWAESSDWTLFGAADGLLGGSAALLSQKAAVEG